MRKYDVILHVYNRENDGLNNHKEQGAGNEASRVPQKQGSAFAGCRVN